MRTYHSLKIHVQLGRSKIWHQRPFGNNVEHERKLESTIAPLLDAQLRELAKVLANSPDSRHRTYLASAQCCPETWKCCRQSRRTASWKNLSDLLVQDSSSWASSQILQQRDPHAPAATTNETLRAQFQASWSSFALPHTLQQHDSGAETDSDNETQQTQLRNNWKSVYLSFGIDDIDRAASLLLKIVRTTLAAGLNLYASKSQSCSNSQAFAK